MDLYGQLTAALVLVMQLSLPVIIAATAVGLIVGLLQTLTQIQDQTLPMAVKLIAVAIVIALVGAGLSAQLVRFTEEVFARIPAGG